MDVDVVIRTNIPNCGIKMDVYIYFELIRHLINNEQMLNELICSMKGSTDPSKDAICLRFRLRHPVKD